MRGDSLRDFYAKALALLGLGMLAGAGAVVDYWPTAVDVPRVARAQRVLPQPPGPVALPKLSPSSTRVSLPAAPATAPDEQVRQPADHVAAVQERQAPRSSELVTADAAPDHRPLPLLRTTTPLMTGQSVVLTAAPSPSSSAATAAPAVDIGVPEPLAQREMPGAAAAATLQLGTTPASDGVSGALKKTGASIVKGGAATGASIADAFRSVFGAFKKVSPFAPDIQTARAGLN